MHTFFHFTTIIPILPPLTTMNTGKNISAINLQLPALLQVTLLVLIIVITGHWRVS